MARFCSVFTRLYSSSGPTAALSFLLLVAAAACSSEPTAPNVDHIEVDLQLHRFEQALSELPDSAADGAERLRAQFPVFFDSIWLAMATPDVRLARDLDSQIVLIWQREPAYRRLLDTVNEVFGDSRADTPAWPQDLEQAMRYAKYYLPGTATPEVYTYVTGLQYQGFVYPGDRIGAGLDYYLGAGYGGYYDPDAFPEYIKRSMNVDHLVPNLIDTWLGDLVVPTRSERMLDRMLTRGRELYVKTLLLPHLPDTAVLGFSEQQLDWLRANEDQMWAHYLDEELLYETRSTKIAKHVGPAPTAPGMPPESPGGGANWIGLQIVRQYMQRHPEQTIEGLLALTDAQELLNQSRYRP